MQRIRSSVIACLVGGGLSACGHATGPQPLGPKESVPASAVSPGYSAALVEMAKRMGWHPADLALRMATGGESEKGPASGTRSVVPTDHPLDGLSDAQIEELFTATGLRAEDYLPHKP